MQLRISQRKHARMKMALQGPSGSGKTFSSLQLAHGLCGDWAKIAVIDTENSSSDLYSDFGPFKVLSLVPPYTPEKYIDGLIICEKAGMEVIIIDSLSHEWENLLEYHSSLQGNSFTNWSKITPRHNHLVQRLLQSPSHIIATLRTKQDYVLNERNGKMIPEKIGLKSVQRDGLEYEFTLVFDLDMKNHALASKDRTGLYAGKPEQTLSADTGKEIQNWCLAGAPTQEQDVTQRIQECRSLNELLSVYKQFPAYKEVLLNEYEEKKKALLAQQSTAIVNLKSSNNGSTIL